MGSLAGFTNQSQSTFWRRPADGFTLIEMLVVILIMGLLVGLVSVSIRPDARSLLRIEAERLALLINLAASEASLTRKTIGWTSDGPTYKFWRGEGASLPQMRSDGNDDLLRERELPAGMIISALQIENMRREGQMRLVFTPYAQHLIFRIELSLGDEHYAVVASAGGIVRTLAGDGLENGLPAL
jgi:general secretion pathway protein H